MRDLVTHNFLLKICSTPPRADALRLSSTSSLQNDISLEELARSSRESLWAMRDLNPRPFRCKRIALPTELIALNGTILPHIVFFLHGHVAELVDALRSGRSPRKGVEVQILSCPLHLVYLSTGRNLI